MKNLLHAVLFAATLTVVYSNAEAAWLIDTERYHMSVHGQMSCRDCHEDVNDRKIHPDPLDVNKSLKDFFQSGQCTACHEDVTTQISEDESHGGLETAPWRNFNYCIECHDPHYQVSFEDDAAISDASQPADVKCSRCHEFESKLPEFSDEDPSCLECHLEISADDTQSVEKTTAFCLHCHSADSRAAESPPTFQPLIEDAQYESTPHSAVSCRVCHPGAAEFGHRDQAVGDCKQCHLPHDEKLLHDAHTIVTCEACHLEAIVPVKDRNSKLIVWRRTRQADNVSPIHQMQNLDTDASCRTCHVKDNSIGAAAMVLPAKSILCMPCHAATFSIGDTVTVLSLIFFLAGFIAVGSVWFSGSSQSGGTGQKSTESINASADSKFLRRLFAVLKSLAMDGLLQRRLFKVSKERWLLHALIFYSIMFRFLWGLSALLLSLWRPAWPETWLMLDKNQPLTAFLFDLSGMMIIIGAIGMMMRSLQKRSDGKLSGLPPADWPAYALLGGIILGGFFLEGMRMAMTGSPGGAPYAFVGDAVSRMLTGFKLTGVYGYVWYVHAILTGAFLVYLPFSRMFHIIMAPVVIAVNAAAKRHP